MPRVVLVPGTPHNLEQHVGVEMGEGFEGLSLQQLVLGAQLCEPQMQLGANRAHGALDRGALRNEVRRRIDGAPRQLDNDGAGERIDLRDALDCVAPELDAHRLLIVGGKDLDRITAHAERASLEAHVIALVLYCHEVGQQRTAPASLPLLRRYEQLAVELRIAEAVNGGDAGQDDDVVALPESGSG